MAHAISRLTYKLGRREQLLMLEIGPDKIDSASSFVDYISESYSFSKSSAWYCLKKLRDRGLVDFAAKGELGKPLELTKAGEQRLAEIGRAKTELLGHFSMQAYKMLAMRNPMIRG